MKLFQIGDFFDDFHFSTTLVAFICNRYFLYVPFRFRATNIVFRITYFQLFISGVLITSKINGVIFFSNFRFY